MINELTQLSKSRVWDYFLSFSTRSFGFMTQMNKANMLLSFKFLKFPVILILLKGHCGFPQLTNSRQYIKHLQENLQS